MKEDGGVVGAFAGRLVEAGNLVPKASRKPRLMAYVKVRLALKSILR